MSTTGGNRSKVCTWSWRILTSSSVAPCFLANAGSNFVSTAAALASNSGDWTRIFHTRWT